MTLSSNDLILYSGNIKGHVILLDWRLHVILTFSHQRTLLSLIMNNANQLHSVDWSNNSNMLISPDWWIGHHYYHMIKSSPVRVCVWLYVCVATPSSYSSCQTSFSGSDANQCVFQ